MGLYGRLVQSREYRTRSSGRRSNCYPSCRPRAEAFDLRFADTEGSQHVCAQLLLVSNNAYQLDPLGARRARGEMDKGTLGVVAVHLAPPPSRRVWEWIPPSSR